MISFSHVLAQYSESTICVVCIVVVIIVVLMVVVVLQLYLIIEYLDVRLHGSFSIKLLSSLMDTVCPVLNNFEKVSVTSKEQLVEQLLHGTSHCVKDSLP